MKQIKISDMEDKYNVVISVDKTNIMVENLSVPDSCILNIYKNEIEDVNIPQLIEAEDWKTLICELIYTGYLN